MDFPFPPPGGRDNRDDQGRSSLPIAGPALLLRRGPAVPTNGVVALRTKDFDYELPDDLIASHPLPDRSGSRMMVVDRATGRIEHRNFHEIGAWVYPGDLWVLNDTKVIPARVFADDGRVEILCLEQLAPLVWRCLVRPGRRMKLGRSVQVAGVTGRVTAVDANGDRVIEWEREIDLEQHGHLALPHYMKRPDEAADRDRYQTVYARAAGAIAAPTAGLHFTPAVLDLIPHAFLTLHVGVGTFRPVTAERPEDHVMHAERYLLSPQTAARINAARRVVAVGTTVARVLESVACGISGSPRVPEAGQQGTTDIFLYPPHEFRAVDALLTNFHLPQSTLLMLVSAFAGRELVLEAYRQAVAERYRFFSYGDCMLVV